MNDTAIDVQRLSADKVEAVCALARDVWQDTYPTLISQAQIDAMLADRYAAATVRTQLDDPDHAWWIAREGDSLVGFAHALWTAPDCKLDKLYVRPDRQRRGIGSRLVDVVRRWAAERDAKRVWLQVNRGNAGAIAAYARYGFALRESRVFDIGNGFVMDDHILERAP